jgi:hypothetical protein
MNLNMVIHDVIPCHALRQIYPDRVFSVSANLHQMLRQFPLSHFGEIWRKICLQVWQLYMLSLESVFSSKREVSNQYTLAIRQLEESN